MSPTEKKAWMLCPLCGGRHKIMGGFFMIRGHIQIGNSEFMDWEGYHSEAWCDTEYLSVVKVYDNDMQYTAYFTNDGIPF